MVQIGNNERTPSVLKTILDKFGLDPSTYERYCIEQKLPQKSTPSHSLHSTTSRLSSSVQKSFSQIIAMSSTHLFVNPMMNKSNSSFAKKPLKNAAKPNLRYIPLLAIIEHQVHTVSPRPIVVSGTSIRVYIYLPIPGLLLLFSFLFSFPYSKRFNVIFFYSLGRISRVRCFSPTPTILSFHIL